MQSTILRATTLSSSVARSRAALTPRVLSRASPLRASRTRGFASVPSEAAHKTATSSPSMIPVEVYPLLGIVTAAVSYGLYIGYTHLRYDHTVNVLNKAAIDVYNQPSLN